MNMTKSDYKKELRKLQIDLVKLQRHIISSQSSILILFEGRDAAGKDGLCTQYKSDSVTYYQRIAVHAETIEK